jgi:hypothetical protein
MNKSGNRPFPRWGFAILAVGGLLASGIFIGIMSVEGIMAMRIGQAVGFGLMGLLMLWGAIQPE